LVPQEKKMSGGVRGFWCGFAAVPVLVTCVWFTVATLAGAEDFLTSNPLERTENSR
jgi:hypothetical protein